MNTLFIRPMQYAKAFLLWLFTGILVGIPGGVLGSLFHLCVDKVTELRLENPWIMLLLPAGGALIALMYRLFGKNGAINTDRVLQAADEDRDVPPVTVPLIFISSVVSHMLGASVGREGAALQLGGGLGYNLGKLLRFNKTGLHIIVMAGMSAVFSALFGTPVTAAFFAIEVISTGVMHYGALVSCTVAALCAFKTAELFGISPVRYTLSLPGGADPSTALRVAILSALCAFVGILFCKALQGAEKLGAKHLPNAYLRGALGGVIIIFLTLILRTTDYNGAGMEVISRAMTGAADPEAFILKILFTAVSVAAGFKGGEIVPALFTGSTFGCIFGGLLGLDPAFGGAIGFVALFCSVVNCPAASFILAIEVFGGGSPLMFALAVAVSYMLSGNYGLYKAQKIPCSRLSDYFEK